MLDLTLQSLRVYCRAISNMALPTYKGSSIRGALFTALRRDFCMNAVVRECLDSRVRQACPVCALLAPADEENPRGIEVARPCTVEPPLDRRTEWKLGEQFTFGLTLFGEAEDLLPYVVLGLRAMGEQGIGNPRLAPGRFAVTEIAAFDPIAGTTRPIYRDGDRTVSNPGRGLAARELWGLPGVSSEITQVRLELLTPMRLVVNGGLVKRPVFPALLRRLLRRASDLTRTATGVAPELDYRALLEQADQVVLAEDRTRWTDVPSYSRRQGRATPIGGLEGSAIFRGRLAPFLPWLCLGALTHVGKDATKGNGWYRLVWRSADGVEGFFPAGASW